MRKRILVRRGRPRIGALVETFRATRHVAQEQAPDQSASIPGPWKRQDLGDVAHVVFEMGGADIDDRWGGGGGGVNKPGK